MFISELVIEVTRRCNMECCHCLRGDAQSLDLDLKHVETLFSRLEGIGTLTFTGGEPSLAVDKIEGCLAIAERLELPIDNFYIVTNGLHVKPDFFLAVAKWYAFCGDNELSQVCLSNDQYHAMEGEPGDGVKLLEALSFFSMKDSDSHPLDYRSVIPEGRGADMGGCGRFLEPETIVIFDRTVSEAPLYLNCKGNMVNGCDWSYDSQDEPEALICHVEAFCIEALKAYKHVEIEPY